MLVDLDTTVAVFKPVFFVSLNRRCNCA
ncbi:MULTISPECIES: hypothetical protein [Pseudomonas syringae group]|nr:hypothetical protein [Pseudomonas viridiflava]